MISNCFFWAHWHRLKLVREWRAQGCPPDRVPAIQCRPSRCNPNWVQHWVVGWYCYETGTLHEIESFVPDDPRDAPWWLVWTRLLFRGHVKRGDVPSKH